MKLIDLIVGARPNFIKIAPIIDAIHIAQGEGKPIKYRLVHTGQHYDANMSGNFFRELRIPDPDINLEAGGGSQSEQAAAIMIGYENVVQKKRPDMCIVVGDVTSTMACAIVARKMGVEVAHVEGGIRSGDWTMPEEINRIVTDSITSYFFTTSETANENLKMSGVQEEKIIFVGNTMIDSLLKNMPRFQKPEIWDRAKLKPGGYLVLTLHRPANVDEEGRLVAFLREIISHARDFPIIFPIHPRTEKIILSLSPPNSQSLTFGLSSLIPPLLLCEPLGYLEFNYLVKHSKAVITDSGGITEEATVMGVPCMTLRDSTERPETITIGTNELLGTNPKAIPPAMERLFSGKWKKGSIPPLWDGNTAGRIVGFIINRFENEEK